MMRFSHSLAAIGLGLLFVSGLSAQAFPFQLVVVDQNKNTTTVANGATLTLATISTSGKVTITVTATYRGTNTAALGEPQLLGSPNFAITSPLTATTLTPNSSASLQLTYTPTSGSQSTAQISIPFTETSTNATTGATATVSSGSIIFGLVGAAPQFVLSYFLQPNQNVLPLSDGGTLAFPVTLVGAIGQAVIQIQNTGSSPGLIQKITVTGDAFQTTNVPLLPGVLNVNGTVAFGLLYTPKRTGDDTGKLTIEFPDRTVTVNLTGTGTAPNFEYQLVIGSQVTTLTPGQALSFISAPLVPLNFSITVQNTGTGNGTVSGFSLSGVGFIALDVPPLPQVLQPGGILTFNLSFIPPAVGAFNGRVRIGNDSFVLTGTGTGSQLAYTFSFASAPISLTNGSIVPFSPVQIGQSASGTFTIQNSGSAPATIIGIFIADPKSSFTLSGLPDLPVTLQPGDKVSFTVTFSPSVVGSNTATLRVDNIAFNLSGSGNAPPALPDYTFQGGGVTAPLQQPAIALTLKSPYSMPVTGTLAISQNPQGFSPDPSVQFSTGGGTVAFTIPANSTQAIFPNNATSIRMQTGSVANTITVTPAFTTTGGFVLTPSNPGTLQFTVPSSAPQLSNVTIAQTNANGFTLQVTGVVTSRSLTSFEFTFTPVAAKFNIANTKVVVDISSTASNWFQSTASIPSGGQFVVIVPFTLTTTTSGITTLPAIQSVSVTATNPQGTSNAVTTQFQ